MRQLRHEGWMHDRGRLLTARTTKPCTSGGAYLNRMSDLCQGCAYRPTQRTGERACPFTADYWSFVYRNQRRLAAHPRTLRAASGMERLGDLDQVLREETARHDQIP